MEVLVSINSPQEAKLVAEAGVKWIDLKDTSVGALASLAEATSANIIEYLRSVQMDGSKQAIISATVGDAFVSKDAFVAQISEKKRLNIDVIKIPYSAIALFDDIKQLQVVLIHYLSEGGRVIVVFTPQVYSELAQDFFSVLSLLKSLGMYGVMLDTADKSSDLWASMPFSQVNRFVVEAKQAGFFVGLAGGLHIKHLANLKNLAPDIAGFRSGISVENNRTNPLCPTKLQLLVEKSVTKIQLYDFY